MSAISPPLHTKMQCDETDFDELMKSLADSFNVLADEVQLLSDRKTILEHKLRFAHEQYQHLADKCAPSDSEISKTLAQLQLPLELKVNSLDGATFVPLPSRRPTGSKQRTAEAIRDGRRASQRIAALRGWRSASETGDRSTSGMTDSIIKTSRLGTSATSVLEQDFTVPGKKSQLLCPFAAMANKPTPPNFAEVSRPTSSPIPDPTSASPNFNRQTVAGDTKLAIHHPLADPICADLYAETHPSTPPSVAGSAAKCPIRFLDQHSPEEVARYFETHKHEIPRSHEICVKRYQRNEEDIRKLDAKYGNLVSMISGLGQKHQPMLQVKGEGRAGGDERKSIERVQHWAKAVSADSGGDDAAGEPRGEDNEDREGRFDRPMRDIRVGESPSRPWGISVPYVDKSDQQDAERKQLRPAAVPGKATANSQVPKTPWERSFGHGQKPKQEERQPEVTPSPACPFGHGQKPTKEQGHQPEVKPQKGIRPQPAFIQQPGLNKAAASSGPQMVFTGPVFIGYSIEQAMALMQQSQASVPLSGRL